MAKDATHFRCDSCSKIKKMDERLIVKATYTKFNSKSEEEWRYSIYHVAICDKCRKGKS